MHNIEMFVYPLNVSKKDAERRINEHVERESDCGGLYNSIRWIDADIRESREDARVAIDALDRGNYDCLAVRFYDRMTYSDKKLEELRVKENGLHKAFVDVCAVEYPKSLTSAYLGCKSCGSKLSIRHLRGNFCPVCKADLRPESMQKKIDAAQKRWIAAQDKIAEYVDKHAKKEVKWLVKIEYHS